MGGNVSVSVRNETPYTWYYSNSSSGGFRCLRSGCTGEYEESVAVHCYIHLRFEDRNCNSLSYEFNSHKGSPTFTIRESWDRSQIELHCNTERNVARCPNYGRRG